MLAPANCFPAPANRFPALPDSPEVGGRSVPMGASSPCLREPSSASPSQAPDEDETLYRLHFTAPDPAWHAAEASRARSEKLWFANAFHLRLLGRSLPLNRTVAA